MDGLTILRAAWIAALLGVAWFSFSWLADSRRGRAVKEHQQPTTDPQHDADFLATFGPVTVRSDGQPLTYDDALAVAVLVRRCYPAVVAEQVVADVADEVARREAAPLVIDGEWRALGGAA